MMFSLVLLLIGQYAAEKEGEEWRGAGAGEMYLDEKPVSKSNIGQYAEEKTGEERVPGTKPNISQYAAEKEGEEWRGAGAGEMYLDEMPVTKPNIGQHAEVKTGEERLPGTRLRKEYCEHREVVNNYGG